MPISIEQRIGRVDRIGQAHAVRAVNFVFEGSVEHRVREVLEQKLAVIFEEFGIDKTGDVLDSAQAGHMFNEMYVDAILNPEKVEESVESMVARLQEQARGAGTSASVLGASEDLEPGEAQRLLTHPLPHFLESRCHGWCTDTPKGPVSRIRTQTSRGYCGGSCVPWPQNRGRSKKNLCAFIGLRDAAIGRDMPPTTPRQFVPINTVIPI
jgi:hypothetical protein